MSVDLSRAAALEAAIASRAERFESPAGATPMTWRRWGSGRGAPLVFLHGGYGSWAHWIRNVEVLAERFDVWAGDLPGLGDSAPVPKPHTVDGLAHIIAEGIARLDALPKPVNIVAFSFGSMLSGHVAATRPELVKTYIAVGTAGLGLPRGQPRLVKKAAPALTPDGVIELQRENLASLMFAHRRNIDDLAIHLQIKNVGRARVASPPLSLGDSLARDLPAIKAPTAFLWGELDATCHPHMDQRLALLREKRPDAPVHLFPDAGHWVQYEDAAAFNAHLPGLIERLSERA